MKIMRLFTVFLAVAVLSGCSSLKTELGLDRNSPDEFTVVKRAPLSIPPEYRLRPPEPGATRPQEQNTTDRAKQAVFGDTGPEVYLVGQDDALIRKVGTSQADPNIRAVLDKETGYVPVSDQSVAERLVFWKNVEDKGVVVDAKAEAERIKSAKAKGEPINAGETPVIERRSTLDDLF